MKGFDRLLVGSAALCLAGFGLLPLANWIPGGFSAPWYGAVFADLLNGSAIAVGLGIVLALVVKRGVRVEGGGVRALPLPAVVLAAFVLYLLVARLVFSGKPLLIDEIIQVYQARILASGQLSLPAAPHQEFFSSFHLVEQGGRVYGQFPMGGPAMLALGTLAGAEWLVNPVFAALSVLVFGRLLALVELRPGVRLGALLLFALAPFAVFMAGSHMNHVPALFWLLLGALGMVPATTAGARARDGLLAGLGFGIAFTIRPVDALAFGVPAGVWLLARAISRRELAVLLAAGIGAAVPAALLLWANLETTGAPLRFGYTVLWGRAHDLGFHATPWGPVHTPARGLELVNLYFLRLQTYLFEAAGPSLLPATLALALTRRVSAFDRYLLCGSALLVGAYFAYWHDGFYLGPRFMYPLLPLLVWWTARCSAVLHDRLDGALGGRGRQLAVAGGWAVAIAALLGLATALPIRLKQYRSGLLSLRFDADRAAAAAGVRDALVLVRESWGAELVARMWALGISRPDADALYRAVDPCRLDGALARLEGEGIRGAGAVERLAPLRADSVRLVSAEAVTGDPSLRLTPGSYPPSCLAKIAANRSGFTLFPPLLLARGQGNRYARDLGPRDSLLLPEYAGRPVYLLKPESGAVGAAPVFTRLSADSLLAAWRQGR